MIKVSKEFWVSDDFIKIMDESTRLVSESVIDWAFSYPIQKINTGDARSKHKITISYEIDRVVTIKESDIDRLFSNNSRYTYKDIEIMKRVFFGGGENE